VYRSLAVTPIVVDQYGNYYWHDLFFAALLAIFFRAASESMDDFTDLVSTLPHAIVNDDAGFRVHCSRGIQARVVPERFSYCCGGRRCQDYRRAGHSCIAATQRASGSRP
jgi:hypothetical protein